MLIMDILQRESNGRRFKRVPSFEPSSITLESEKPEETYVTV